MLAVWGQLAMSHKTALVHQEPISDLFHKHYAWVEYRAVQMESNPCHPLLAAGLEWLFLLSETAEAWRAFQVGIAGASALILQ